MSLPPATDQPAPAATAPRICCERSAAQQPGLSHCSTLCALVCKRSTLRRYEREVTCGHGRARDQPRSNLHSARLEAAHIPAKPPSSHHHALAALTQVRLGFASAAACLPSPHHQARLLRSTATWTAAASACASAASCASSSTAQQTTVGVRAAQGCKANKAVSAHTKLP